MTFARFMERALYHPEKGYYAANRARIGKSGDFFTNVSVGSLFGRLLAGQFEEMWLRLGKPASFTIVEQAANNGRLAHDILSAAEGEFAEAIVYHIVEPFSALQNRQRAMLSEWDSRVAWFASLEELPSFRGVHFSNELIDALPFHLLRSTVQGWEELFVENTPMGFGFIGAAPSSDVQKMLSLLPLRPPGTLAELRPAADDWLHRVAARLEAGFVLVIDYGYGRDRLFAEHRTKGTFACYHEHRRDEFPLANIGEKDITAHVDFTQLAEGALREGLQLEGFADQHHYLVGAAEKMLRGMEGAEPTPAAQKTLRTLQTLLHPETMGTQFHYLAFSRKAGGDPGLSGFRHARNPQIHLFANPEGVV